MTFQSFFGAFCVEQAAISILKRYGFEPVMSPDWFSLDKKTLSGIVFILDELGRSIRTWEAENYVMEYNFFSSQFQPNTYGKYLRANRLGERELKNAMLDRASKGFLDDYINEIERRRRLQHR